MPIHVIQPVQKAVTIPPNTPEAAAAVERVKQAMTRNRLRKPKRVVVRPAKDAE